MVYGTVAIRPFQKSVNQKGTHSSRVYSVEWVHRALRRGDNKLLALVDLGKQPYWAVLSLEPPWHLLAVKGPETSYAHFPFKLDSFSQTDIEKAGSQSRVLENTGWPPKPPNLSTPDH